MGGLGIAAVAIVTSIWYKLRVKQWEMSLKHSMLERGMSAEEIKTVLDASPKGTLGDGCWSHLGSTQKHV